MVEWNRNSFAGNEDARANLRVRLPIDWAAQNNVPLYVGEWGTNNAYSGYVDFIRDRADLFLNVFSLHHAHFVWRGDADQYGLFPRRGELVPHDQAYLDAAASSWEGAVRPEF
jgi:hypothetical protein